MTAGADDSLAKLADVLGHRFNDPSLLRLAVTHSSASGRLGTANERLEFLGDRVLGLIIADLLYRRFPIEEEGDLPRRFAVLVSRETLAQVAGRIGLAVLRRLKPFDMKLHYTDRHRLPAEVEEELGATFHPDAASMVEVCDVVTINAPLHPETENLFDAEMLARMKRGSYLINTARGKICDRDAVAAACESGQLAGYAGDVWFPQPAPKDHPWRTMPHHGMTPHTSGTSLSAQARYAAGAREILECWFDGRPIREEYLIVDGGRLAGAGAHSYSEGDATGGSEEAARFKGG